MWTCVCGFVTTDEDVELCERCGRNEELSYRELDRRRFEAATAALTGNILLSAVTLSRLVCEAIDTGDLSKLTGERFCDTAARGAVAYADVLMAELAKGKRGECHA